MYDLIDGTAQLSSEQQVSLNLIMWKLFKTETRLKIFRFRVSKTFWSNGGEGVGSMFLTIQFIYLSLCTGNLSVFGMGAQETAILNFYLRAPGAVCNVPTVHTENMSWRICLISKIVKHSYSRWQAVISAGVANDLIEVLTGGKWIWTCKCSTVYLNCHSRCDFSSLFFFLRIVWK